MGFWWIVSSGGMVGMERHGGGDWVIWFFLIGLVGICWVFFLLFLIWIFGSGGNLMGSG